MSSKFYIYGNDLTNNCFTTKYSHVFGSKFSFLYLVNKKIFHTLFGKLRHTEILCDSISFIGLRQSTIFSRNDQSYTSCFFFYFVVVDISSLSILHGFGISIGVLLALYSISSNANDVIFLD